MINKNAAPKLPSSVDLRRVFETAVEEIQQPGKLTSRVRYGAPIVARSLAAPNHAGGEKRALSDAARALAVLWKLPATSR
ncbi:MAG: hypothetical protein DMG77_02330 [Acidobacteria bacterium]|nr:MAG: hypothetical protein DMG77_02330 [Acidobacteriota bacterium]